MLNACTPPTRPPHYSETSSASRALRPSRPTWLLNMASHTLFGWQLGKAGRCEEGERLKGGLRVGLGPPDMPQRLEALEKAVRRYVSEHGA